MSKPKGVHEGYYRKQRNKCILSRRRRAVARGAAVVMAVSMLGVLSVVGHRGSTQAAPVACEMVSLNGESIGVCPELAGGREDPNAKLRSLTQFLADMEGALADSVADAGVGARLNVGEPFRLQAFPTREGSSEVTLHDGSGVLATGFADVVAYHNSGNVALVLELTEGEVTRTLDQWLRLSSGVLTSWGTLTIEDAVSSTTLAGGWSYDAVNGPMIDPDSDPGFVDELAAMLHVPDITGRGFSLGTVLTFIGNIVSMVVNYTIDLFIPYTPPLSCSGPSIYDGNGQSCDGVNIACDNNLSDACEMIGDIPGVSSFFKQCMKGRCGCGGSSFRRLRISCDIDGDCADCGPGYAGCSLAGSRVWYCEESQVCIDCIGTLFHEMSHGCGAPDSFLGLPGESDRIGNWFADEFDQRYPNACVATP